MNDVNYLSEAELKELTAISKNVDTSFLEPFITTAEQMWVSDILGKALDTELKGYITGNTLSGDSETLVVDYIIPCSAYATWLEGSPWLRWRTTNKGIVTRSSDSSDPISDAEFEMYKKAINDKLHFYRDRLLEYLKDNQDTFPNWRDSSSNPINTKSRNSNGIHFYSRLNNRNYNPNDYK